MITLYVRVPEGHLSNTQSTRRPYLWLVLVALAAAAGSQNLFPGALKPSRFRPLLGGRLVAFKSTSQLEFDLGLLDIMLHIVSKKATCEIWQGHLQFGPTAVQPGPAPAWVSQFE